MTTTRGGKSSWLEPGDPNFEGNLPYGDKMLHCEVSPIYLKNAEFVKAASFDTLSFQDTFRLKTSFMLFRDLVNTALSPFGSVRWEGNWSNEHLVRVFDAAGIQLASVSVEYGRRNREGVKLTEVREQEFTIYVGAQDTLALAMQDSFKRHIETISNTGEVTWWYRHGQQMQQHTISLPVPKQSFDAFYPFLGMSIDAYLDSFMASDANILLLLGDPGTGKTSFLRWMLHTKRLAAMITYDESILKEDHIFVSFALGDDDVFIIEDADTMLSSRERDQNTLMSKFLNISDGMIKFPNRKLIFTTNLTDVSRIDPALMRSGRCFDVLRFRPLTVDEAEVAASLAGLESPRRAVTLAELFNGRSVAVPKFGF